MGKSFLGFDLKTVVKVVLWVHMIENLFLYVLSLTLMINSRLFKVVSFEDVKLILMIQENLEFDMRLGKSVTLQSMPLT